jgi:hypothetical protein
VKDEPARHDILQLGRAVMGWDYKPAVVLVGDSVNDRLRRCQDDARWAKHFTEGLCVRYCPTCRHRALTERVAHSDDLLADMVMRMGGEPCKVRCLTCGGEFKEAPDTLIAVEKA